MVISGATILVIRASNLLANCPGPLGKGVHKNGGGRNHCHESW